MPTATTVVVVSFIITESLTVIEPFWDWNDGWCQTSGCALGTTFKSKLFWEEVEEAI
jgi:hypothetical protein